MIWPNRLFTSQVFKWNVFLVLCLEIWWRHEIWKRRTLKIFIFSRTERAIEVELKTFFSVWQVLSFILKKQISKILADTTFNFWGFDLEIFEDGQCLADFWWRKITFSRYVNIHNFQRVLFVARNAITLKLYVCIWIDCLILANTEIWSHYWIAKLDFIYQHDHHRLELRNLNFYNHHIYRDMQIH